MSDTGNLYRCSECNRLGGAHRRDCALGRAESALTLDGLQVIVNEAVRRGTLHAIAPPPIRGDYPTRERFEQAYGEWEHTQLWTVTNIRGSECD